MNSWFIIYRIWHFEVYMAEARTSLLFWLKSSNSRRKKQQKNSTPLFCFNQNIMAIDNMMFQKVVLISQHIQELKWNWLMENIGKCAPYTSVGSIFFVANSMISLSGNYTCEVTRRGYLGAQSIGLITISFMDTCMIMHPPWSIVIVNLLSFVFECKIKMNRQPVMAWCVFFACYNVWLDTVLFTHV